MFVKTQDGDTSNNELLIDFPSLGIVVKFTTTLPMLFLPKIEVLLSLESNYGSGCLVLAFNSL